MRLLLVLIAMVLLSAFANAEEIGGDSMSLKPEEVASLRELIARPVDQSALNTAKTELYRQKDAAAFKLGDIRAREAVLREWVSTPGLDSNIDARWTLSGVLFQTENRKEAYDIGNQLIKEIKGWPPSEVRIRAVVAQQYINDNNLIQAKQLLDEADSIILNQWSNPSIARVSTGAYWKKRAEMEFYRIKATYLLRIGKWDEGIETAKKASESGKALIALEDTVDERQRVYGRSWGLNSSVDVAQHQLNAGLYAQADLTLRDTYAMAQEYGFTNKQLNHFFNTAADLEIANGQYTQALKYVDKSEKINEELGFKKGSSTWMYMEIRRLRALIGAGRWRDAQIQLDEIDAATAAVNGNAAYARLPYLRGYIYFKNGKYAEAAKLYEGNLKWGIQNYGENHYLTSFARGMYASALWKSGQVSAARKEFQQAVKNISMPDSLSGDYVEDSLRKKYKKTILENYLELLSQNLQTNSSDSASIFEISDLLNSSVVQQSVTEAAIRTTISNPRLAEVVRQEQDAKNEMASLNAYIIGQGTEGSQKRNVQVIDQMRKRLVELQQMRLSYKEQIQKEFPEYYQLIHPKPPSIKDLAATLKSDELFVSILPLENSTYVFAVDSQGNMKFHKSPKTEADIGGMVQRLRRTLDFGVFDSSNPPAFDFPDSYQLYQSLFAPIESSLAGKKHLIVSTSGPLSSLPLAVLTSKQFSGSNLANAPWLIDGLAISYMPSASGWVTLSKFSKTPSAPQPFIAWGDPKFDLASANSSDSSNTRAVRESGIKRSAQRSGFESTVDQSYLAYTRLPQLPETRDEVLRISKSLQDSDPNDVFLGAAATRASVLRINSTGMLNKKRVVVFATHGLRPGDLPGLGEPALAMAANANQKDSPLLTLQDVMGLKMNADWTVLSACNTAGEDGKAGEALSGLARGFFFAGSRSLLVTHWSVESDSAMQLTTQTFDSYNKDPTLRRSESLRMAMLGVMKDPKYSHPAFWAPYTLVGDGGR